MEIDLNRSQLYFTPLLNIQLKINGEKMLNEREKLEKIFRIILACRQTTYNKDRREKKEEKRKKKDVKFCAIWMLRRWGEQANLVLFEWSKALFFSIFSFFFYSSI
jgi:hypothetical protein